MTKDISVEHKMSLNVACTECGNELSTHISYARYANHDIDVSVTPCETCTGELETEEEKTLDQLRTLLISEVRRLTGKTIQQSRITETFVNLSGLGLEVLPVWLLKFENLERLYCQYNKLTSLPEFPNLKILNCSNNELDSLPEYPKLEMLNCSNNKLTTLPEYPLLSILECNNNRITSLPEQPKLAWVVP